MSHIYLLLYYITDRTQFAAGERERHEQLIEKISQAARAGIDYVQLREKDLSTRELELLAREALARVRDAGTNTRLLINSRTDVAMAVGADGVHLRSRDVSPHDVRKVWRDAIISVSCHTQAEVIAAEMAGANFVVFGPVFGKGDSLGAGLQALPSVCKRKIPVLPLGAVTIENARACIEAGAAGLAGIRLFQENDIAAVVEKLRDLRNTLPRP